MGLSYTESKTIATKTILLLGGITIFEVFVALLGKGYIISGFHINGYLIGALMIIMSLVKAYFIVYEFMHMKYEAPGLLRSVLLPTMLLIWGAIAFFWEGSYWNYSRKDMNERNKIEISNPFPQGSIYIEKENNMM